METLQRDRESGGARAVRHRDGASQVRGLLPVPAAVTWYEGLLLGFVQGATEFLPVSSSGHLVMGQALLGVQVPGAGLEVALHAATL
ncbi:MAG: hypothetical protein F4106_12065, partial [Gemmatimonadetes bacterium]|nr:hypothetical protein [Gemmatimonadota bacterium]